MFLTCRPGFPRTPGTARFQAAIVWKPDHTRARPAEPNKVLRVGYTRGGRRIIYRMGITGQAGRADWTGQGREQNVSNQNARGRFRVKQPSKRYSSGIGGHNEVRGTARRG